MITFHDTRYEVLVYRLSKGSFGPPTSINVSSFSIESGVGLLPVCNIDIALETSPDGNTILDYGVIAEQDKIQVLRIGSLDNPNESTMLFQGIVSSLQPQMSANEVTLLVQCESELGFLSKFNLLDIISSCSVVGASDYLYWADSQGTLAVSIAEYLRKNNDEYSPPLYKSSAPQPYPTLDIWPMIKDAIIFALEDRLNWMERHSISPSGAYLATNGGVAEALVEARNYVQQLRSCLSSILPVSTGMYISDVGSGNALREHIQSFIASQVAYSTKMGNVWSLIQSLASSFQLNVIPVSGTYALGVVVPKDPLRSMDIAVDGKDILALVANEVTSSSKVSFVGLVGKVVSIWGGRTIVKDPGVDIPARPTIYPPRSIYSVMDRPFVGKFLPVEEPLWMNSSVFIPTIQETDSREKGTFKEAKIDSALPYRYAQSVWEWESIRSCTAQLNVVDRWDILPGQTLLLRITDSHDRPSASASAHVLGKRLQVTSNQESTWLTLSHFRLSDSPVRKIKGGAPLYEDITSYSLKELDAAIVKAAEEEATRAEEVKTRIESTMVRDYAAYA